jgi:hypothetical protein
MVATREHDESITGLELCIECQILVWWLRFGPQMASRNESRSTIRLRGLLTCDEEANTLIAPYLVVLVRSQRFRLIVPYHIVAMKFLATRTGANAEYDRVVQLWL